MATHSKLAAVFTHQSTTCKNFQMSASAIDPYANKTSSAQREEVYPPYEIDGSNEGQYDLGGRPVNRAEQVIDKSEILNGTRSIFVKAQTKMESAGEPWDKISKIPEELTKAKSQTAAQKVDQVRQWTHDVAEWAVEAQPEIDLIGKASEIAIHKLRKERALREDLQRRMEDQTRSIKEMVRMAVEERFQEHGLADDQEPAPKKRKTVQRHSAEEVRNCTTLLIKSAFNELIYIDLAFSKRFTTLTTNLWEKSGTPVVRA